MPYQCFFVKTSAEVFSFIPSADGTPSADTAVRRWRRLYAQGERTQWPPSAAETPCPRRGNCRLRRHPRPPKAANSPRSWDTASVASSGAPLYRRKGLPSAEGKKEKALPRGRTLGNKDYLFLFLMYSSIAAAARLPAPIARMTVAAPVTASPPAKTPSLEVMPCSSSATMQPLRLVSRPGVV